VVIKIIALPADSTAIPLVPQRGRESDDAVHDLSNLHEPVPTSTSRRVGLTNLKRRKRRKIIASAYSFYDLSALPTKGCAMDHFHGQRRLHCNLLRAWFRFAQKMDEEIRVVNAVAVSMAGVIGHRPSGETGRESVADTNGT
jgi:hypothetical protein